MRKEELQAILQNVRARSREQERLEEEEQQRQEEESRLMIAYHRKLLPRLRRASTRDYAAWLAGHLSGGGEITNVYPYKLPKRFFVLSGDLTLEMPLYGSAAVSLIVPAAIKLTVSAQGLGHCTVFWMKDYTTSFPFVALYSDIDF